MKDKALAEAIIVMQGAAMKKMIHSGRFDFAVINMLTNICKKHSQAMELLRLHHGVPFTSLTAEELNAAAVLIKEVTGVTVDVSADVRISPAIIAASAPTQLVVEAYEQGATTVTRHSLATKPELKARRKAKDKIKVAK